MKKNCYIYWDEDNVYILCEGCFQKKKMGLKWPEQSLYGRKEVKCSLCDTIIYKKEKRKINEKNNT